MAEEWLNPRDLIDGGLDFDLSKMTTAGIIALTPILEIAVIVAFLVFVFGLSGAFFEFIGTRDES